MAFPPPLTLEQLRSIEDRLALAVDVDQGFADQHDAQDLLAEVWRLRGLCDEWGTRLWRDSNLSLTDLRRALGLAAPDPDPDLVKEGP